MTTGPEPQRGVQVDEAAERQRVRRRQQERVDREIGREALAAGADDVLSKPFRLGDLIDVVQKLTAKPSA